MPLDRGVRLGPYEIIEPLGAGGMGEVYRARDPRLGRDLAIKVLTPSLAQDAEALGRFEREARTASSLNHPNIVHIYEIGEAATESGPVHYIAMEYIEGQTLRARLKAGERWKTLLEPLTSVAEALAKAHKAGIVHRDLKPENVMITSDGYPKVVDFGIAKLFEGARAPVDDVTAAEPDLRTGTGTLLGTPSYMSPEQAQGKPADHRSDIFSFGCILYEATTGRRTFAADSVVATLHAIVYESPSPVESLSADAPLQLHRIVNTCLAKDPSQRYQLSAELVSDLRALSHPSTTPNTETAPTMALPQPPAAGARGPALRWLALGVLTLVAAAALVGWRARSVVAPTGSRDVLPMQVEKLTNRGTVTDVALSGDGRYIAYLATEPEPSLWLRDLKEKTETRLVQAPSGASLGIMRFARDDQSLFYNFRANALTGGAIYRVPLIGGTPRPVRERIGGLSPDDRRVSEGRRAGGEWRFFITDLETGVEKPLGEVRGLTWSPDGSKVLYQRESGGKFALFVSGNDGAVETRVAGLDAPFNDAWWRPGGDGALLAIEPGDDGSAQLLDLDLVSGATRPLGARRWNRREARWLPDASGLVINEFDDKARRAALWFVSYPEGQARRIPADNYVYAGLSLSADGARMASVQTSQRADILVSSDAGAEFKKVLTGTDVRYRPRWLADGRIVFSSNETGTYDLYVADADGGNRTQLTFDRTGNETEPAPSPDGRYIVFVSDRTGERGLYRINRDGTGLVPLTPSPKPGHNDRDPEVTPDSRWVLYRHWDDGPSIWKLPIEGGTPVVVRGSGRGSTGPVWESAWGATASPDGTLLAYFYSTTELKTLESSSMDVVVATPSGRILKRFPFMDSMGTSDSWRLQWSHDGSVLYYAGGRGGAKVWKQALVGGAPIQVTQFDEPVNYFDWSPDGKKLLVSRSSTLSDAVLITHFH